MTTQRRAKTSHLISQADLRLKTRVKEKAKKKVKNLTMTRTVIE